MRALIGLVTALVYRRCRRVPSLAHTSPTGVPEVPSRTTGTTTRALDRLERPRPGAIVAVTPRREKCGPGEMLDLKVVVIAAPD
jgi:hypothetical protein